MSSSLGSAQVPDTLCIEVAAPSGGIPQPGRGLLTEERCHSAGEVSVYAHAYTYSMMSHIRISSPRGRCMKLSDGSSGGRGSPHEQRPCWVGAGISTSRPTTGRVMICGGSRTWVRSRMSEWDAASSEPYTLSQYIPGDTCGRMYISALCAATPRAKARTTTPYVMIHAHKISRSNPLICPAVTQRVSGAPRAPRFAPYSSALYNAGCWLVHARRPMPTSTCIKHPFSDPAKAPISPKPIQWSEPEHVWWECIGPEPHASTLSLRAGAEPPPWPPPALPSSGHLAPEPHAAAAGAQQRARALRAPRHAPPSGAPRSPRAASTRHGDASVGKGEG